MINAIGLENVGVDAFLTEKLPWLRDQDVPVVVNIFGNTLEEYREVATRLDGAPGVTALEINISCPNVKQGGMVFGTDPAMAASLVATVRQATNLPLITKLTPNVTRIGDVARAAVDAGSDIISCINTVAAMAVDVFSRRPKLANIIGGLSGPAIKPVALRCVYEVTQAVVSGDRHRWHHNATDAWNSCWWGSSRSGRHGQFCQSAGYAGNPGGSSCS
jgi:dihydroorotate dehydrogenase (NAD+) catalytic subunit